MKILINKSNFLKNLNLDRKIEESSAIVNAVKDRYSSYKAVVKIDGNLVTIDLTKHPEPITETLIATDSLGYIKLNHAIPILERLLENESFNSDYYTDLFNAYELRGDFIPFIDKFVDAK